MKQLLTGALSTVCCALAYLVYSLIAAWVAPSRAADALAAAHVISTFFGVIFLPLLLLSWLAGRAASGRMLTKRWPRRSLVNAAVIYTSTTLLVLLLVFFLFNRLIYARPADPIMLALYLASIVAAIPMGLLLFKAARSFDAVSKTPPERILVPILFAWWLVIITIDNSLYVHYYTHIHRALLVVGLLTAYLCFALAIGLWGRGLVARRGYAVASAVAVLALMYLPLLAMDKDLRSEGIARLITRSGTESQMIFALRWLFDRDRDGYSSFLYGQDPDDGDPRVIPLGDVLRARRARLDSLLRTTRVEGPASKVAQDAATSVVLISVDAFRCGLIEEEVPPFAGACPRLLRLSRTGQRHTLRVAYPETEKAIPAMFSGVSAPATLYMNMRPEQFLPGYLRRQGYSTGAVVTHRYMTGTRPLMAGFDVVDSSIADLPDHAAQITSRRTVWAARKLMRQLRHPFFMWIHFFDPHWLYVSGNRFDSSREAYLAEVRRTDRQVAALMEHLLAELRGRPYALILVGDHGEEFGEHGGSYHGTTLYEEVSRVPLVLWSSKNKIPAAVDRESFSILALPGTVCSLVGIAPAGHMHPSIFSSRHPGYTLSLADKRIIDRQFAVCNGRHKLIYHHRQQFLELFDLRADPGERVNLAYRNHDKAREMTALLKEALLAGR